MEKAKCNVESTDLLNCNATETYCLCKSSIVTEFMIQCDICAKWYHGDCVGITAEESECIDIYCCIQCKKQKPASKTTYKFKFDKHTTKKYNVKVSTEKKPKTPKNINMQTVQENAISVCNETLDYSSGINASSTTASTSVFNFVDTTIRKAKTNAYEKFKFSVDDQLHTAKRKTKSKIGTAQPSQCYGPGCTKASAKNSKYCSDTCGLQLAQNRILEILPARMKQWLSTPPVADEISRMKLADIRIKLDDIKKKLEALDVEIIHLMEKIKQWKDPKNIFVEQECDDNSISIDCVLCGTEVQSKTIERHLEHCYKKLDSKIYITERIEKPDDLRWNVFCNRKITKNLYCKKMKVLCPQHYKDSRKEDEVCGYKLGDFDGVVKHCGNKNRTCKHVNWEEWERAELDLKKLTLLLKYNDLVKEKTKIKQSMRNRGNFLGLMLHETVAH